MDRDTVIDAKLRNWGAYQREGCLAPRKHAKGASWQQQIASDGEWLDLDAPEPVDDDDAELVQHAMIRCVIHDLTTATILKHYYRDDWDIDKAVLRRCRAKFWKWL